MGVLWSADGEAGEARRIDERPRVMKRCGRQAARNNAEAPKLVRASTRTGCSTRRRLRQALAEQSRQRAGGMAHGRPPVLLEAREKRLVVLSRPTPVWSGESVLSIHAWQSASTIAECAVGDAISKIAQSDAVLFC
jgi:hypothetical protein